MVGIRKYLLENYNNYLTNIYQSINSIENYKIEKKEQIKIKLKKQIGGNQIEKIEIEKEDYYVNVRKYKTDEYGYKQLYFYEISEELSKKIAIGKKIEDMRGKDIITCGILQINVKDKIANIDSLGNYENCVICIKNDNYKIGDIILKIMIKKCKEEKIIKINLKDNSLLNCENSSKKIKLSIFRTLTKGFPYYLKYGFYPENNYDMEKVQYNMTLYEKKPKITSLELKKITGVKNLDLKEDIYDISYLIDKFFNSSMCNIVEENYEKIYDLFGYKNVYGISYCLNLEYDYINNFIDKYYKKSISFVYLENFRIKMKKEYDYDFNFNLIINILENKNIKIFAGKIFGLEKIYR